MSRACKYNRCFLAWQSRIAVMKIPLAALITALIAAEIVNKGETQTECGYLRGVIRLQGGQNEREGRLEVCNDGVWGRVCNGGWDDLDATVVCRQLGLLATDTVAIAVSGSYFSGESSGPSWLDNVGCTGPELTLVHCLTVEQQRSSWQAAQCAISAGILCLESDGGHTVRLVGGRDEREGRVEVFYGGEWGPVCMGNSWGTQEAAVVCRELGLSDNGAVSVNGDQFEGSMTTSVLLEGIECNGSEINLFLCRGGTWGSQQCLSGAAGVVCTQTGGCSVGALRLSGGRTAREGRVEACHGGVWGTVCSGRGGTWVDTDADIVCRRLGFQEEDEIGTHATDSAQFGHANGVIWLFSPNCGPQSCTPQNWANNDCLHTDDVAVTCPDPKEQLHLCVNIESETILLFKTLHSLYTSVASAIVNRVLSNCTQPCSYSTRDVTIDISWSTPILPASLCVTRNTPLQVKLTCRYRPHLNEHGRVQFAARTTLGSLGRVIDCANYRGYVITEDLNIVDCMPSQSSSVLLIGTPVVASSTINLIPVTKSKDISTNIPVFGRPKYTTFLPRIGRMTTTSFFKSSVQVQTTVVMGLMSTTAPVSLPVSPSATSTSVSEVQVNMQLTRVYRSNSRGVDSTVVNTLSSVSMSVPNNPTNEEDGTKIDWFMAFLAGLLVGCVVFLLVSVLICMFLFRKKQEKRRSPSGDDLTTTSSTQRPLGRENSMQVNSMNPLSSTHSSPDTCYYEDIDGHEYAVLEQTLPSQQQRPREEAVSQSSVSSTPSSHKYAFLMCPERIPATMITKKESLGNCIPDTSLGTVPEYAILEPEPGIVAPASVDYSKLYICSHDYQRVLLDSSGNYDRTFSSGLGTKCT